MSGMGVAGEGAGWSAAERGRFMEVLAETLEVRAAARAIGRGVLEAHEYLDSDGALSAQWAKIRDYAYRELEMRLLRDALDGCERTEVTVDEAGTETGRRTVRSFPMDGRLRLLQAHRAMVKAQAEATAKSGRSAQGEDEQPDDPAVEARLRAVMAEMRGRLVRIDARNAARAPNFAADVRGGDVAQEVAAGA